MHIPRVLFVFAVLMTPGIALAKDPPTEEALRRGRFELNLSQGVSASDRLVGHLVPGMRGHYYLKEWLGLGIDAAYYRWFDSGAALGGPQSEYLWGTGAGISLLPFRSQRMPACDLALLGRVGMIGARPRSQIDPEQRFDYRPALTWGAGVAMRVFMTRSIAVTLELRDDMVRERVESSPAGESYWGKDERVTHNIQTQLGISVWLPSLEPL